MFEYEMQKLHAADLLQRADAQRLVKQAVKAGRADRRSARRSAKNASEGPVSSLRSRFARAA
ncbi:hypothetical protein J7I98_27430 [Streptomyces sp. ISL-98]|uniref:hypothetical protein n=1 Tax=Streptomyces sp. ISL-98 TaxID=2819192 RepID=UPI001BE58D46|nr:hypothetical protein [Streptomyces sp. ISL-98]MBT2509539.1 hypothetical protein [Streptomyces sp. ISL-98]